MAARVMVADFRNRYDGDREDKRLYGKLEAEREGILAILVWAAGAWHKSWAAGDGGISLPQRIIDQSKAFMERNDPIANWLNERGLYDANARTSGAAAYESYLNWHRTAGEEGEAMSQVRFTQAVEKKGFKRYRITTSRGFEGFRLYSTMENAERGLDEDEDP
jgi:phage/plasmid-associated DNA primase